VARPAVVAARLEQVDLLERVPADVAGDDAAARAQRERKGLRRPFAWIFVQFLVRSATSGHKAWPGRPRPPASTCSTLPARLRSSGGPVGNAPLIVASPLPSHRVPSGAATTVPIACIAASAGRQSTPSSGGGHMPPSDSVPTMTARSLARPSRTVNRVRREDRGAGVSGGPVSAT
jgi:hypothetical protein